MAGASFKATHLTATHLTAQQRTPGSDPDPGFSTAALKSSRLAGCIDVVPTTSFRALSTPRNGGLSSTRRQVIQPAAASGDQWMREGGDEFPSAEAMEELFSEAAEEFLRISALEHNSQSKNPLSGALINDDSLREQAAGAWEAQFQGDEGEEGEDLGDVGFSDDEDVSSRADEYNWETVFSGADDARLGPGTTTGLLEDSLPLLLGSKALGWCGLCGGRSGWIACGACDGLGAYPTKPGLGGKSGVVGLARCKTCYGWRKVPCILCGVKDRKEWARWQESARRRPNKVRPLGPSPG